MTTQERQRKAERYGMLKKIGEKVKFEHSGFRNGDVAEIVGWGVLSENNKLSYFVKYENAECIALRKIFDQKYIMSTTERQRKAEEYGMTTNIGRKIKSESIFSFRSGDTAEIIGWGFRVEDNRPMYFIRFENGECDSIAAGELFDQSGYTFI